MKKILLSTLFVCLSAVAFAESYMVQEATSMGVSKDDAAAATELIRSAVAESKNQLVTQGAKYTLKPKIMKLGNAYMMTLEKYEGGTLKYSSQMKSATIEEMDKVSRRLVRAVMDEVSAGNDARIQDVTETEAVANNKRKEALRRWYLGMGPSFASNVNNSNTIFGWSIAYAWEMPSAALKLYLDGVGANFVHYGIGGHYYFSDRDGSPLVGAQLGYGNSLKTASGIGFSDEPVSGFSLGANVGYQFFRTSTVGLEISLYGAMLMAKNSLGNPTVYGLRVGLYF